ncbi:hypothetical protein [Actinacidiphila bryophytorum]|uniref:Uncharacterized protein n=1 Tax=Actinacidiphila bryophytorum TaxID=1436133 RepID=A0A9W4H623_9ACTN|nr:hypothetical protein [Actinacidiphila bryophytorum]MBM9436846.1 hypothetical protein [Actinacidiphila bryophytorum]MBN6545378.1 hypothetical protein [Actinacidiphila bryophytorum]CAG7654541.1 conserved hypothetical protein [Actinacidiphila bryophytorum]
MPLTPITGRRIRWREATGHDDLLLVEGGSGLAVAVALIGRRAVAGSADGAWGDRVSHGPAMSGQVTNGPAAAAEAGERTAAGGGLAGPAASGAGKTQEGGGEPFDAWALPVGDVDALVADLRRERLGDRLVAEAACLRCAARIDIDFGLADYAGHHRPRTTRAAVPAEESGWWRLRSARTCFRLPTAGDVLAAGTGGDGRRALVEACVRGDRSAGPLRAAERAMAALAPTLRSEVQGTCPECGATVGLDVDVRELCLEELVFLAGGVLDEVHLLASAYHWSERDILGMTSRRRASYAERVRASWSADTAQELIDV